MVGPLTDGDVRLSLVAGALFDTRLSYVLHRNFKILVPAIIILLRA